MPLNRKGTLIESRVNGVACRTVGRHAIFCELTPMVVFVAILTGGKVDGIGILSFVTKLAIHAHMFSFERKISGAVVKGCHGFHGHKTVFRVAFSAVVAHLSPVDVLVAGCTLGFRNIG